MIKTNCLCLLPAGVYLPLLWEQSFCWKSPIALGYTRGHFSALVAMENDGFDNRGAGANLNTDDDVTVTFLPLVDSERKLLHIHFLSAQEVRTLLLCLFESIYYLCLLLWAWNRFTCKLCVLCVNTSLRAFSHLPCLVLFTPLLWFVWAGVSTAVTLGCGPKQLDWDLVEEVV